MLLLVLSKMKIKGGETERRGGEYQGKDGNVLYKCVEEWPYMLTYEEEWTWFAFAFGWGWWQRYDAVMSGESGFN